MKPEQSKYIGPTATNVVLVVFAGCLLGGLFSLITAYFIGWGIAIYAVFIVTVTVTYILMLYWDLEERE